MFQTLPNHLAYTDASPYQHTHTAIATQLLCAFLSLPNHWKSDLSRAWVIHWSPPPSLNHVSVTTHTSTHALLLTRPKNLLRVSSIPICTLCNQPVTMR